MGLRKIFVFALLAMSVACSSSPADPTVYILTTGKKYHQKNCRLKKNSKGVKLTVAKKNGYTPCKVCRPPK